MAFIKNAAEKEKALKEIQSLLKHIIKATQFINSKQDREEFKVSFFTPSGEFGCTTETNILCKNKKILDDMASAYRETLIKKVKDLANTYEIVLTTADLAVMQ